MPKTFTLTEAELQALAKYLSTKPWGEVHALMAMLDRLPLAEAPAQAPLLEVAK